MNASANHHYRTTTSEGAGAHIHEHTEKMKLRLWTFRLWKQLTVLDLFAGMGFLSEEYAKAGCDRLICVEKNPQYFEVLQERMGTYPNVDLHNLDNRKFLETVGNL